MEVVQEKYKNTKIGRIPETWEVVPLNRVGSFLKGKGISKSDLVDTGLPAVRYGELYTKHHDVIREFYSFIPKSKVNGATLLQYGDVLFAGSGETHDEIGKSAAFASNELVYAGGDIVILRQNRCNAIFLGYLLNSPMLQRQKSRMGQGATVIHIYANHLAKLFVPLPPLPEQRKIAEILSTVDEQIQTTREIIEQTQLLKKGLKQKLFSEGIGHTKFKNTKIGRIPESWGQVKIGELCRVINERFEPRHEEALDYIGLEHIESNEHRLLGLGSSAETLSTKVKFRENDILYGKLRPYLNKVWLAKFAGVASTEIMVFRTTPKSIPYFLFSHLTSDAFLQFSSRITEGALLPRIKWKDISGYIVPLPPLPEQSKIVEILSTVDEQIQVNSDSLEQLQQQKTGLMQQLLTGKVRVKL